MATKGGDLCKDPPRAVYRLEREKIRDVLKESGHKIRFRSERATVQSVRSRLTSGCQILHITGHGDAEALEFESEKHCGIAETLKNRDLGNLISAGGIVPDLVFLESYNPEMCGWAVAAAGVPHVVVAASKSDVPDGTIREFAPCFYNELIAKNFTIQEAFDLAVCSVETNVPTTAATFLLLPKDVNHEVHILNDPPEGDFVNETPPLPYYSNLPSAEKAYVEGTKLRELLTLLEDKDTNCVTITGEPGIGKTEIALQACHYMGERNQFSAIFFAACRKATEHSCPFLTSGRPEAHIQHLCRLIGEALHAFHISSPKDLVAYLEKKSGHEPNEPSHQGNPSRQILLVLDGVNALIDGGGIEACRSLADFVDALSSNVPNLKLLVTSEHGLLELTGRCFSNSSEKVFPLGKSDPEVKNMVTRFSRERANEAASQAKLMDERCRDIWSRAIERAVEFGLTKGHEDDAWYRHVPWISLSWALNQVMCEMQTTPNSMEMSSNSDQSSRHRSGVFFSARRLNEGELDFIQDQLSSLKKSRKYIDGERGSDSLDDRINACYGNLEKGEEHEWFSLEVFARFSRGWLGPVIATLSKIQNDWAANDPVKVHGFVSNDKARNQLLKTNQSGVFMFRFSASDPGRLLLVVTRKAARKVSTGDAPCILYIEQFPVTVREDGKWIVGKGRSRRTFNSLHELVHGKRSLETLYRDIPKEEAFPIASPTVSSNITSAAIEEKT